MTSPVHRAEAGVSVTVPRTYFIANNSRRGGEPQTIAITLPEPFVKRTEPPASGTLATDATTVNPAR